MLSIYIIIFNINLICPGLADTVYAEAFVQVHEYDIVLDITIMNQTNETMQV